MRESAFVLLRGTFYRWIQLWPARCERLDDAPRVIGVGDLHLENFGTWRDSEGRLIWGINDVDEACEIPYTLDLVRLATSALLAVREGHLAITARSACDAILDGYATSLDRGGRAFVLEGRHEWLRDAALERVRHADRFWAKLTSFPRATGRVPREKLLAQLPNPKTRCVFVHRIAGVGSLGRQRVVAIVDDVDGAHIAREAKALVPSAAAWAREQKRPRTDVETVLERAVRVPDPMFVVTRKWILRRLAPDCARINLADLPKERDEEKLLRAMGWETANIHLGSRKSKIDTHLRAQPRRWLEHAAEEMATATTEDFREWVRSAGFDRPR